MTVSERKIMADLNTKYKAMFGFPFVICARENKKEAILSGLKSRVKNTVETELNIGTGEVKKIFNLRLRDLVDENSAYSLL